LTTKGDSLKRGRYFAGGVVGLEVLDVDVVPELGDGWLGRRLSARRRLLDVGLDLRLDFVELGLGAEAARDDALALSLDGVARRAHVLHLVARAIRRARIGHRVTDVTVRLDLEQHRAVARRRVLARVRRRLAHRQHIHAVDVHARHVVAALVEVADGGGALDRRAHGVLVVLADEYARQAPEHRHVERLEQLALVRRAVAVQRNDHLVLLLVLAAERDAGAERHLRADDAVAAVEAALSVVEVHRAAAALRAAGAAAEQLGERRLDATAARYVETVIAIRRNQVILASQRSLDARIHSLLSAVTCMHTTKTSCFGVSTTQRRGANKNQKKANTANIQRFCQCCKHKKFLSVVRCCKNKQTYPV
jgi:hypothetical protein